MRSRRNSPALPAVFVTPPTPLPTVSAVPPRMPGDGGNEAKGQCVGFKERGRGGRRWDGKGRGGVSRDLLPTLSILWIWKRKSLIV